jgi:hypothetical protein
MIPTKEDYWLCHKWHECLPNCPYCDEQRMKAALIALEEYLADDAPNYESDNRENDNGDSI